MSLQPAVLTGAQLWLASCGQTAQNEARLAPLHPYEVPDLLALPVADGGAAYLAWVRESAAG